MNRNYAGKHYETRFVSDNKGGSAGLELYLGAEGKAERVARILFWDASGQFYLDAFDGEIPLVIIEELISEVKAAVKTH